jgi:carboxymethylenebutenolidase
MADKIEAGTGATPPHDPARRDFVLMSAATALSLGAGTTTAAGDGSAETVSREVEIRTPDGTCDAHFCHPAAGRHAGVLIWTDVFGLRPVYRDMARRLAARGYAVLVPNPFYRLQRAPLFDDVAKFDWNNAADRDRLGPLFADVHAPGAIERDATAHLAFLDAQPQVDTARPIGTQGYCMGGPLVFRTCALDPKRVRAGATFHGGGLATDKPDSPHLLIRHMHARLYVAVAASDDEREPQAKETLRKAFAASRVRAEVEVYAGCQHGWCMADMPVEAGKPIYDAPGAERAWQKLLALYRDALG